MGIAAQRSAVWRTAGDPSPDGETKALGGSSEGRFVLRRVVGAERFERSTS